MGNYFSNVNPDLLAFIPLTARRILELGCGEGALGAVLRQRLGAGAKVMGIDISADAVAKARGVLDAAVQADADALDAEQLRKCVRRGLGDAPLDALVFGDVLEHLRDPWRVLRDLSALASPDATCVICVPNVAHWSLIAGQMRGHWNYADAGLLDRTHLRFFTLESATALLAQAGWRLTDAHPRILQPEQTQNAVRAFAPAAKALGITPEQMAEQVGAFQWVLRAVRQAAAPPQPLRLAGLSLKPQAGMVDVRMALPLHATASLPAVQARVSPPPLTVPGKWTNGVLVLQRNFVADGAMQQHIEQRAAQGWVVVTEMDDEPDHWPQFAKANYRAFRGVHALTVSTPAMAERLSDFNPNIGVFENAVLDCAADAVPAKPSQAPGAPLRVFFGALNRGADWAEVAPALVQTWRELQAKGVPLTLVVVHDTEVADTVPSDIALERHGTLAYADYRRLLASCDIALLPLRDTPFNRLKSDLKLVECAAAGTVPVCSSVVYANTPNISEMAVIASKPADWASALHRLVTDAALRGRLALAGWQYVRRERLLAHQAPHRAEFYRSLLKRQPQLEAERKARLIAAGRQAESLSHRSGPR